MKRRTFIMAVLALALATLPGAVPYEAGAQEAITLRMATLAPRGSAWMRVFEAWNNSLRQRTNNRLQFRFFPGGSQGDERDVLRKIRINQLDGAAVTSTGLSLVVRPVLVLQAPGVVENYQQLDRARNAMSSEFSQQFEQNGMHLLGWGDVGQGRIFSNRPISVPSDLRQTRPWIWRDDSMFGEFLGVIGVTTGVRLGVPEVLPALSTGQVYTVVASATAASALQWHTRVTHVTERSSSILVGATIMSQERYAALPDDLRQALDETSAQAHTALVRRIRQDDERYYRALTTQHGLTAVPTQDENAWRTAAQQTRDRLAGRIYPRELMERVMAAARGR